MAYLKSTEFESYNNKGTTYITSNELRKLTSGSYRQIDYWIRIGIVPTVGNTKPGSGNPRCHDLNIVDRVKLLVQVSNAFGKNPHGDILKKVYNNYDAGFVDLGEGIILSWRRQE